eukprot:TRINITY_DN22944_c0_g6_i1.p1 TRINITY_DN22944_c0_g6~~TRINITY_DN22944_c0_g6_i1.p1  ORF type:complete len:707 (+),score=54.85 TRINITY_DN22944_c0_g6_i1:170-2290(+)
MAMASNVASIIFVGIVVSVLSWEVPWYLDCRHSREWSSYRDTLQRLGNEAFEMDMFWWSHTLLEKTEPIFFKVQDSKHLHFLCDPNETLNGKVAPAISEDEDSVFAAKGGTDQWSAEERERRSFYVKDFCYYGYITAAAYRTRLEESEIPGVLEGRRHALTLLRVLLMSRSNAIDFLDSSNWPIRLEDVLKRLYPPYGPAAPSELLQQESLDDTEISYSFRNVVRVAPKWAHSDGRENHRGTRILRIVALGYHTSLALELVSFWTEFLNDVIDFEVAAHILEPAVGTAAEVRKSSLCRDFRRGEFCAWDARLLYINKDHFDRSRLPISRLPSPVIADPEAFIREFAEIFHDQKTHFGKSPSSSIDTRIENADLHLCTEPAILCGAVAKAFPDMPIIGYFANPLMSYVPAGFAQSWLAQFRMLGNGRDEFGNPRKSPFLAVASTRFLAEQMRFQTGVRVLTARPLATYLGPPRGVPRYRSGQVVVLRAPSVFWNSACILNSIAKLNEDELAIAHRAHGAVGLPVPGMKFVASEELEDGASEVLASFEASIIFPYDVSQMRLYELYALGLPLLVPAKEWLPAYIYRGMTTIDDFNHDLPDLDRRENGRVAGAVAPHFEHHPFNRLSWPAVAAWTELTHWNTLPHLLHCAGVAEMLLRLARDDLRPVAAGMRRRQERDVTRAVHFWTSALADLGFGPKLSEESMPPGGA